MKKAVIYLKNLMPLIAVVIFAFYLTAQSVFFVADGEVKRRQSPRTVAAATYSTAAERLDKLSGEEEPDPTDLGFARWAIAWVVISRVGLGLALFLGVWSAGFAVAGISAPAGSEAALNSKFLLRIVLPSRWCMALVPLLCAPYAFMAEFIAHLYRKYYLYDVTLGYHGIPSFVMLIIGLALSVALVFIAAPFEKESHMDPYRRI